jgi:hypothetical protein
MDLMIGPYLARRGKKRYCDKNLGTALYADLLLSVYPEAKFICLHRHPMDVIASGIEACPWGLANYGFEPYVAGAPGNSVLALARYWADHAAAIVAVEDKYPGNCHRVRYEDLVEDPEGVMQEIYSFIGVQPAPGVAEACFSGDRERFGPADHKIWATSEISGDSVGRGESVPAGLIVPQVTEAINELAATLGYLPVDAEWGTPGRAADPRVPDTIRGRATSSAGGSAPGAQALEEGLRARLESTGERVAGQWEPCPDKKFLLVARTASGGAETQWLVDAAARTITMEAAEDHTADDHEVDDQQNDDDDVTWSILGTPQTWDAVLSGQLNLQSALRHNELRYCPAGDDSPIVSQTRIEMLADLFGLGKRVRTDQRDMAAVS